MTLPLKPEAFQPGRVWSLLEVLKLFAASFLLLGETIGSADIQMSLFQDPYLDEDGKLQVPGRPHDAGTAIKAIIEVAERLELPVSVKLFKYALESGQPRSHGEWMLLRKALYGEIEGKALFYVPRERVEYFENDRILSDPAKLAFATGYAELREAGSCFASGRFTSTVLHSMRAAEVGVKAMARALGYAPHDLDQLDWHPVLTKCESLIQEMRDTAKKGPEKEVQVQFYSQAASQFRHFKDGWRVQAAHSRPPFNEYEAKTILDATISFFETLSLQLSEDAAAPTA